MSTDQKAMSVRLPADTAERLRELASRDHRSMNETVIRAIEELAARESKSEQTRRAFARIQARDAEAIDLLSR